MVIIEMRNEENMDDIVFSKTLSYYFSYSPFVFIRISCATVIYDINAALVPFGVKGTLSYRVKNL